jgi:hypothetical protein
VAAGAKRTVVSVGAPGRTNKTHKFCHATAFERWNGVMDIEPGDVVGFELRPSRTKPGKMEAADVRVLN